MPEPAAAMPVQVALDRGPPLLRAGLLAVLGRYPEWVQPVAGGASSVLPDVVVRIVATHSDAGQPRDGVPVLTLTWRDCSSDPATGGPTISVETSTEELVRAIVAASGRTTRPGRRHAGDLHEDTLSPRERDVLRLICRGMSNREMAEHLMLGINSVKTHVRLAYLKMAVSNRSRAVLWGIEHGYAAKDPAPPDAGSV